MKDFLEKYHHLYTDNFYTTPKLYRYLKEHKTSATGTVRSNRKGMPKDFRTLKIEKGQRSAYETKDLLALLYNYFNFSLNIIKDLTSQIRNEPKAGPSFTPRLVGYHFPQKIPAEKIKKNPQKRCKVCYKHGIRVETRYQCKSCTDHPGLCPDKCFEIYHTKLQY
ncbi:PiggyBac transposable element-derived protein 4 [Armadillidium vulgare]|nr:PiggyBac transposable element-derived protein 4 [Armadillidium vulgare]